MVSVWHPLDQAERKMRWKYLNKTTPSSPQSFCPRCQKTPVIKAVNRKGEAAKMARSSPRLCPCNEAWHRRHTETKQGSPASERGRRSLTPRAFNNGRDQPRCAVTSVKHWSRWRGCHRGALTGARVLTVSPRRVTKRDHCHNREM